MGITLEGQAGPRQVADGSMTELRQGRTGELCWSPCHGSMAEAAVRGKLFSGGTVATGTTIVAGNVSPVGAAAASILSIYNPFAGTSANVNAILHRIVLTHISGTPGAGQYLTLDFAYNQVVTATPNNNGTAGLMPVNHLAGGNTGMCQIYTQTALTGAAAQTFFRHLGAVSFATALAATTPNLCYNEVLDGEIVIPPGGLLSIGAAATGTSHVVAASFTWEEVPA